MLKDGRASLQALSSEKKQLLEDADDLMARKAALEVSVSDLDSRVDEEKVTKVSVECCIRSDIRDKALVVCVPNN